MDQRPTTPFSSVAMLCQGTEIYGIGTIQRLYASGAPGILFVCHEQGALWEWLGEKGHRRVFVPGLSVLTMDRNSVRAIGRLSRGWSEARATAARLDPVLRAEGISIVHTHWLPQQIVAGLLRRRGYKVVWQINNNTNAERLWGLGPALNKRFASWGADMLLPASDYIARNWTECGVEVRVIRNSAEPRFELPNTLPPDPFRCVIAGRMDESKGHHLAVEGVLAARSAGLDVRLDVYGGPTDANPYLEGLRARVAAAGASEAISFLGFRTDLRANHQNYHLGFQCRIDPEPCSLWVCETLVDGLPLIASASGGTPELVADGVTGYLFPPGDGGALTARLLELCRDREGLARMRVAAFERGRMMFTHYRMMDETARAYEAVMESGRA